MDGVSSKAWLATVVSRCQQLSSHTADRQAARIGERVRALSAGLPGDVWLRERFGIRHALMQTVNRVARASGIGDRPELHTILFEWMASDIAAPTWQTDLLTFVDRSANVFAQHSVLTAPQSNDLRTARALHMIATRYKDRNISLGSVAADANLSEWHLARLLKRTMGLGFKTLLHRTRIAAARRLLEEGSLSVKEIAAVVGYSTSSQFCRHFKRLTGTTPARYRASYVTRIA